jgi:hypothetical protein
MCDEYNGWTNRETWAVALHINNDQGWQESVLGALRQSIADNPDPDDEIHGVTAYSAGQGIKDSVGLLLDPSQYRDEFGEQQPEALAVVAHDIGSLYRVDWTEIGRSFLESVADES